MYNKSLFLHLLFATLCTVTFFNCTVSDSVAGGAGGTEIPNSIAGTITLPDSTVAASAIVTLSPVPSGNSQLTIAKIASKTIYPLVDTTDDQGAFSFTTPDTGSFLLVATVSDTLAVQHTVHKPDQTTITLTKPLLTQPTGSLLGIISFIDTPEEPLTIQLLGTQYSTTVDTTYNTFTFMNVPLGAYTVRMLNPTVSTVSKDTSNITIYSDSITTGTFYFKSLILSPNDTTPTDTTSTDTTNTDTTTTTPVTPTPNSMSVITGIVSAPSIDAEVFSISLSNGLQQHISNGERYTFNNLPHDTLTLTAVSNNPTRDTIILSSLITDGRNTLEAPISYRINAVIVDGISDHNWKLTTDYYKRILESTGRFSVDIATSPPPGIDSPTWDSWSVPFDTYDVVILNFASNWETNNFTNPWSHAMKETFESYLTQGGGVVIPQSGRNVHGKWRTMQAIMGLGKNPTDSFPGISINQDMTIDTIPTSTSQPSEPLTGTSMILTRSTHPIVADLPPMWLHTIDTLDRDLRGPLLNMEILSFAQDTTSKLLSPFDWIVTHGAARIYNGNYGHIGPESLESTAMDCIGLQTLFIRGTEWAATGIASYTKPEDFPSNSATSVRAIQ
ncbi:MAG: hypothetical protein OCD01_03275 [Fibrobacterales bacterium]